MNEEEVARLVRKVRGDNAEMAAELSRASSAAKAERSILMAKADKIAKMIGTTDSSVSTWLGSTPSKASREEVHLREMAALTAQHAAEDKALILGGELKEARTLLDQDRQTLKHMEALVRYLLDQVGGTLVLTPNDIIDLDADKRRVMIYSSPETQNVTVRMED